MSHHSRNFKVQISLRRAEDDGSIFQKTDGERFEHSVTVKLNVNTKYSVFVTTKPALTIESVMLRNDKLELEQQKMDDNCCVYHSEWSTVEYEVTKSSARTILPIVVQLEHGVRLEAKLQLKLYPQNETSHSRWGREMHMLDLDCTHTQGDLTVHIRREQYI